MRQPSDFMREWVLKKSTAGRIIMRNQEKMRGSWSGRIPIVTNHYFDFLFYNVPVIVKTYGYKPSDYLRRNTLLTRKYREGPEVQDGKKRSDYLL